MKNEANLKRIRFLENDRLFLTPRSMVDIDEVYLLDHDREILFLDRREYKARTMEHYRGEFEKTLENHAFMALSVIAKDTGAFMGTAVVFKIDQVEKTAHWGIILKRECWRQGIGTDVARLVLKYVFEDLGFRKLRSGTHSANTASQRLQEKLGFVREGVLRQEFTVGGRVLDDMLYGMLREEYFEKYESTGQ